MMLEMVFHSMTIIEKGYDTVGDANMFNFTRMYFQREWSSLQVDSNTGIRMVIPTFTIFR